MVAALAAFFADRGGDLLQHLRKIPRTIILTTTYSGMGCAEMSSRFVEAALRKKGLSLTFKFHSAMDCDPLCRSTLQALNPGPDHIFGDIYELVTPAIKDKLFSLQLKHRQKLEKEVEEHSLSNRGRNVLIAKRGQAFMKEAAKYLHCCCASVRVDKPLHCHKCGGLCRVAPEVDRDALYIEMAGPSCLPLALTERCHAHGMAQQRLDLILDLASVDEDEGPSPHTTPLSSARQSLTAPSSRSCSRRSSRRTR